MTELIMNDAKVVEFDVDVASLDLQVARREMTMAVYTWDWLAISASRQPLRQSTLANYRCVARGCTMPTVDETRLVDLEPWDVCHVLHRSQDAGYGPGTNRVVLTVLRSMLWQAQRDQLIDPNAAAHVKPPGSRWPDHLTVTGWEAIDTTKATWR